ncbi:hypothetical protein GCM10010280_67190 [Streptomyces pilosus]|uniref:Transposase IS4-like domain-containing protein n=1 Tax=Streptomyces pilosus TaxID=28893 RepID=A0A918C7N9_9ACTN|nr:transposase [Streptomyces pilosus]GGR10008.1 hypothetical protein GCM10010280_67190 [Streptomyces pilosus]
MPQNVIYRVITFAKGDKVAYLGTTLLDAEQYPADELVALYRERWEIELAFDEIKNHLGPGGPIRSRTPEGVRQELWAYLAVHHAIRQFAHTAALARPTVDADRVSYLNCVRIIPSQLGATPTKLTRSFAEAGSGGTRPPPPDPARPGLPTRDQEAEPLACAEDSRQTRHGPARSLGAQPDLEAEEQPSGREAGAQGNASSDLALDVSFCHTPISHCGGNQCHKVVGPAIGLFRRYLNAASAADEVGPVLAREPAATTDTLWVGVKHRPRNVVRVEDQKAAVEVGLASPQSHPLRSDLVARRPLGTPHWFSRHHFAGHGLLAVGTAEDGHAVILSGCMPRYEVETLRPLHWPAKAPPRSHRLSPGAAPKETRRPCITPTRHPIGPR